MKPSARVVFEPEYRFLYCDHTGQDILQFAFAANDDEAIAIAMKRQHGLAVEIWQERRYVGRLPPTIRIMCSSA